MTANLNNQGLFDQVEEENRKLREASQTQAKALVSEFISNVSYVMQSKGITISELCSSAGIDRKTWFALAGGRASLTAELSTLMAIAHAVGLEMKITLEPTR